MREGGEEGGGGGDVSSGPIVGAGQIGVAPLVGDPHRVVEAMVRKRSVAKGSLCKLVEHRRGGQCALVFREEEEGKEAVNGKRG